jgi:Ca2+-binding RTX toxin-like protein
LAAGSNSITVLGVETVNGSTGADVISVGDGLSARLNGGGGGDSLTGGTGNDQLSGGAGADTLTGGSGTDYFIFSNVTDSSVSAGDQVSDFVAGTDLLMFIGLQRGGFDFLGANAFSGSGNSEARFDDVTKILSIDSDGNGSADMRITLTGVSLASLSVGDFLWL